MTDVYVMIDLYEAGYTEDGDKLILEAFYVVVEYEDGSRLAHATTFRGSEAACNADRLAENVRRALHAGYTLEGHVWRSIDPAYGSQAYINADLKGFFKAREAREDNQKDFS